MTPTRRRRSLRATTAWPSLSIDWRDERGRSGILRSLSVSTSWPGMQVHVGNFGICAGQWGRPFVLYIYNLLLSSYRQTDSPCQIFGFQQYIRIIYPDLRPTRLYCIYVHGATICLFPPPFSKDFQAPLGEISPTSHPSSYYSRAAQHSFRRSKVPISHPPTHPFAKTFLPSFLPSHPPILLRRSTHKHTYLPPYLPTPSPHPLSQPHYTIYNNNNKYILKNPTHPTESNR